jgi:hypothetical protein
MMPRVLQQVMFVNNDSVHRVMNKPNDPDSLIHSFHALHHAVNTLRYGAVIADSISRVETTPSVVSEGMPSPISLLHCTSNQQSQQYIEQPATTMEATNHLQLTCPSGSDPTLKSVGENNSDTFYFCDRMILFENPDIKVNEGDELTMALISSTLLFNFAVICNRYGMQHSDSKRTLLLQRASKVYYIVIEMLIHTIMTSPVTTTSFPNYHDGVFHQVGSIELLLTLVYNNLGLTFYKLCMFAEYNESMVKLNNIVGNQNVIFDLIRPTCFADIIEEIKLNAIYWKSFVPSPIALAA